MTAVRVSSGFNNLTINSFGFKDCFCFSNISSRLPKDQT